jgi:hypothetical protein
MNLRPLLLAFALAAILDVHAQNRAGQDRYKTVAPQSAHAEKMQQSIDARIARASEGYEKAAKVADPAARIVGLVSLRERITLASLDQLRAACACQILAVQRTIGETQMGWGLTNEQLASATYMRNLEAEYKAQLESTIGDLEVELRQVPADSPQARYSRQKLAAFSNALAELRASGLMLNGVVFAATPPGLAKVRAQAPVLAIEIMTGTQQAFAIPLEIYQ